MKKILLTGFEPFDGRPSNPSQMLAEFLSQEFQTSHLILPVSYGRSIQVLKSHLEQHTYDFILMFGLASDRDKVYLERVGLNLMDSRIPDADGDHPQGEKIDSQGEGAFFSGLPLKKWIENSEMAISNSAGAYVCNFIYYQMLQGSYGEKSLFVHVPWIEHSEQEEQIKKDLRQLIKLILNLISAEL